MVIVGEITASGGIEVEKWLSLIKSHEALTNVPPQLGVNPFTRQPCEFKAPPTSALILASGINIGTIHSAMDGSPVLIVEAQENSLDAVARVAAEVANALDGSFLGTPREQ